MNRLQYNNIINDLRKKLVFIVGPRQVGKTWLAKEIFKSYKKPVYLNYDNIQDRAIIENMSWVSETDLLVFDELHKMPDWKNHLKGIFDTRPAHLHILVTGSSRMDMLRQTGDSLAGRFFTHRLLPLSLRELAATEYKHDIKRLIARGGFPEPFLTPEDVDAQRWRNQYVDGLIREDIHDLDKIRDIRAMQLVLRMLRQRVGSPVSFASIARDVNISPSTVLKYVQMLEALYIIFRVTPFSHNIARSLLKEPKMYFFDTGMVDGDSGARFENFTAVSLLKHVCACVDYQAQDMALHYIRTKEGNEVDFCISLDGRITKLIEAKVSETHVSRDLKYFCDMYTIPGIQLVMELRQETHSGGIEVRRAVEWCEELAL